MRKLLSVAAFAAVTALALPAAAQSYNLTLAGASPGGLWSLLGAGIDGAVKQAYPGSTVTYQTSGGGFANIAVLQRDEAELGIVHDAELLVAKNGGEPFSEPIEDMRVISYLYTWAPMHFLIRKDFAEEHGIESFSDLAEKQAPARIAINKQGNIAAPVAVNMLSHLGITEEQLEDWGGDLIYAASGEQTNLMQDRRVDVILNSLFVNHRSINQAAEAVDLLLLPVSAEVTEATNADMGTQTFTIPGGSYGFQPDDVVMPSLGAALVVRADMSEEDAYNLTKALFENYEALANVHKAMNALTPEIMASQKVVPYHDGAKKYLEEAGLM
ncbi:MAG: TAXI family TRAP transporter solute-binding subunit [Rhodovibrionaceae bacterium]